MKLTFHERMTRYNWYHKAFCQFTLLEWLVVFSLFGYVIYEILSAILL
jgi:hypothetical protein